MLAPGPENEQDLFLLGFRCWLTCAPTPCVPGRQSHCGSPVVVLTQGIGAAGEERFYGRGAATSDGAVQWRGPIPVACIRIGAARDKTLDRLRLCGGIPCARAGSTICSIVQRLSATTIARADGSFCGQKLPYYLHPIRSSGNV
jgi:hypothetical protein